VLRGGGAGVAHVGLSLMRRDVRFRGGRVPDWPEPSLYLSRPMGA
jgi:hypothetical protein